MPHILNAQDQWFLDMHRNDPLTGGEFQMGEKVVVCAKCRTVQLWEIWSFENQCCKNGTCSSTDYRSDFSREFIDFSYHRNEDKQSKIKGFKVVERDKKYKRSLILRLLSERKFKGVLRIAALLMFVCYAACILLGLYTGFDAEQAYISAVPIYYEISTNMTQKINNSDFSSKIDISQVSDTKQQYLKDKLSYLFNEKIYKKIESIEIEQKCEYISECIVKKNEEILVTIQSYFEE